MPISSLITFKAGQCDVDTTSTPAKVKPQPQPGFIYLYSEDVHFCWRKRSDSPEQPELDLVMVPTDGSFVPYEHDSSVHPTSKTNGRIFVLKFASSSQRYLFWLQSAASTSSDADPSVFSPRDRKIGDIVHRLLQGEEVNVTSELAAVQDSRSRRDGDGDEPMEDVEGHGGPHDHRGGGSGGAGPGLPVSLSIT
ncbi:hypothetical protein CDD82_5792 [Ophiocordyceps australis]|uniref:Pru domain-containing protein n=1 Tax=Ophiocordyceps australis TaxID=1399860 RepID=A0A2C5YTG1_9HYPO|nr:hypothetical protein CDD82_5792 [Ophiocordyceps australis]